MFLFVSTVLFGVCFLKSDIHCIFTLHSDKIYFLALVDLDVIGIFTASAYFFPIKPSIIIYQAFRGLTRPNLLICTHSCMNLEHKLY